MSSLMLMSICSELFLNQELLGLGLERKATILSLNQLYPK